MLTKKTEAVKKPTLKPTKKQQLSEALVGLVEVRAEALKKKVEAVNQVKALCEEMFPVGCYVEFTHPGFNTAFVGRVIKIEDEFLEVRCSGSPRDQRSTEALKELLWGDVNPERARRLVYAEEAADE